VQNDNDFQSYVMQSFNSGRTCLDAISKFPGPLEDRAKEAIVRYYRGRIADSQCEDPPFFAKGALKVSVWQTTGHKGLWGYEQAVQILPSVSLGFPINPNSSTDVGKYLGNTSVVSGLLLRYTPLSYMVAGHAIIASANGSSQELDPSKYKNPTLRLYGVGVSALGNLVGVNIYYVQLGVDGLRSASGDKGWAGDTFIDLGALAIGASGALAR
jgi:hypothetical protein